jgi:hypothetical protein
LGGGYSSELWDWLWALIWCGWVAGIPVVVDLMLRPRDGDPSGAWSLVAREASVGLVQGFGLAKPSGADSLAEWSSSSADLWGMELVGWLFFY